MSDTINVDAVMYHHAKAVEFARTYLGCQNVVSESDARKLESERDALKARVKRLEEALEFGVGANRAKELMRGDHIGEPNEMVAATKEVPCPDCYGGHFRPCNICGDSGVALLRVEAKEAKP